MSDIEKRLSEIDMEIRPEIMAFARLMEQKMRKHDGDWGASWKEMQRHDLLGVLYAETRELISALLRLPCQRPEEVDEEAADVANAAMFCAWNQGALYRIALEGGKEPDTWGRK